MLVNIRRPLFWTVCVLSAFFVYWPSLTGAPLWDDLSYWFYHPSTRTDFPWWDIWRNFNWPLSVSLQKGLFLIFKHNYVGYHLVNLAFHLLNTFLVWAILRKFKVRFGEWIALAFLVHPANVISVAWMIQLKTLLCFTCAAGSLLAFDHAVAKNRAPVLAWLLFAGSILAKSASLVFPVIVVGLYFSKLRTRQLWWLMPFFLVSLWGVSRLYSSPVTKGALKVLSESTMSSSDDLLHSDVTEPMKPRERNTTPPFWKRWPWIPPVIISTLYHYFWQVPVPKNLLPIKDASEMYDREINTVHLAFLLILVVVTWRTPAFALLVGGYAMLLPFLGILSAPYMNITYASDQHLYLAIPLLLAFWINILERFPWKKSWILLLVFCLFLSYKAHNITPWYKDEVTFFDTVLMHDPDNVPVAYNLAMAHFTRGEFERAIEITESLVEMSKDNKGVRVNRYFPYLAEFHMRLMDMRNRREN